MKKIIWFFGECGSGRKTLINNILNNTDNIREDLGLTDKKITVAKETIEKHDKRIMDIKEISERDVEILKNIKEFTSSDNDILLIKGQYSDFDNNYHSLKTQIHRNYPDLDKEFYLLGVKDLDLLYERMTSQEWFRNNYETNIERFPKSWISISVNHLKNKMNEYEEQGYKVTEIDTTEGYVIENQGNKKTR